MADTTRHLLAGLAPEAAAALLVEQAADLTQRAGRILWTAHASRSFKITRGENGTDITQVKDPRAETLQALKSQCEAHEAALDALAADLTTEAEKHQR